MVLPIEGEMPKGQRGSIYDETTLLLYRQPTLGDRSTGAHLPRVLQLQRPRSLWRHWRFSRASMARCDMHGTLSLVYDTDVHLGRCLESLCPATSHGEGVSPRAYAQAARALYARATPLRWSTRVVEYHRRRWLGTYACRDAFRGEVPDSRS